MSLGPHPGRIAKALIVRREDPATFLRGALWELADRVTHNSQVVVERMWRRYLGFLVLTGSAALLLFAFGYIAVDQLLSRGIP